MAWYDYMYECRNKLGPTWAPFSRLIWIPFKPPQYQADYMKMSVSQNEKMDSFDQLEGWTVLIMVLAYSFKTLFI
jgi:hypothetical protein